MSSVLLFLLFLSAEKTLARRKGLSADKNGDFIHSGTRKIQQSHTQRQKEGRAVRRRNSLYRYRALGLRAPPSFGCH